ncbi:uncharacterized protein LAESUDRAFT_758484 [Laetiporus sulphureus 93-53]|uniref:Uncharacterized protein n=1 Tax=Laetiporus sulphureus 93-53 TaxID=1314785 RepID=A0A165EP61_9APHY|nr:uncharacterized protein LAESUDRAFT_758484 [Laetiporus sulphureus 93-53]KZT07472.1 hypothetical protein LAESUDRAFT_758484 [Laetiporus sulphureus 93-53]
MQKKNLTDARREDETHQQRTPNSAADSRRDEMHNCLQWKTTEFRAKAPTRRKRESRSSPSPGLVRTKSRSNPPETRPPLIMVFDSSPGNDGHEETHLIKKNASHREWRDMMCRTPPQASKLNEYLMAGPFLARRHSSASLYADWQEDSLDAPSPAVSEAPLYRPASARGLTQRNRSLSEPPIPGSLTTSPSASSVSLDSEYMQGYSPQFSTGWQIPPFQTDMPTSYSYRLPAALYESGCALEPAYQALAWQEPVVASSEMGLWNDSLQFGGSVLQRAGADALHDRTHALQNCTSVPGEGVSSGFMNSAASTGFTATLIGGSQPMQQWSNLPISPFSNLPQNPLLSTTPAIRGRSVHAGANQYAEMQAQLSSIPQPSRPNAEAAQQLPLLLDAGSFLCNVEATAASPSPLSISITPPTPPLSNSVSIPSSISDELPLQTLPQTGEPCDGSQMGSSPPSPSIESTFEELMKFFEPKSNDN